MKAIARFVGKDGSMGLVKGKKYEIHIKHNLMTQPIRCPYSVTGFYANWKLIKILS